MEESVPWDTKIYQITVIKKVWYQGGPDRLTKKWSDTWADPHRYETLIHDRDSWRSVVNEGTTQ